MRVTLLTSCFLVAALLLISPGCDVPVGSFSGNDVYALTLARSRDVTTAEASRDVSSVVEELFGTPNVPHWPSDLMDPGLSISQANLDRAAGPQLSEKDGTHRGLFREHCVTCHALSGSGAGPASVFQNPYPRDFRPGVYKWKSTQRDARPTRDDLMTLLQHGVAGSGMPSFSLIDADDLDALVDYVIYLSVRGETERELLAAAIDELGYGEDSVEDDARLATSGSSEGTAVAREIILKVSSEWSGAESTVVEVPAWDDLSDDALVASVDRGQTLFHGQIANCVGCHGKGGAGEVVTLDYDDWTKEYSTRLGLTPTDREAMRPFKRAGALTPRLAKPRKLSIGVYRGGSDTESLYRRITQGIAGSPMPAVAVVDEENGTGLTPNQIFDLIRYVQSLSSKERLAIHPPAAREGEVNVESGNLISTLAPLASALRGGIYTSRMAGRANQTKATLAPLAPLRGERLGVRGLEHHALLAGVLLSPAVSPLIPSPSPPQSRGEGCQGIYVDINARSVRYSAKAGTPASTNSSLNFSILHFPSLSLLTQATRRRRLAREES